MSEGREERWEGETVRMHDWRRGRRDVGMDGREVRERAAAMIQDGFGDGRGDEAEADEVEEADGWLAAVRRIWTTRGSGMGSRVERRLMMD